MNVSLSERKDRYSYYPFTCKPTLSDLHPFINVFFKSLTVGKQVKAMYSEEFGRFLRRKPNFASNRQSLNFYQFNSVKKILV